MLYSGARHGQAFRGGTIRSHPIQDIDTLMTNLTPRQSQYAAIFGLAGMGLVIATRLVRPELDSSHQALGFIFGVLPNFAAAFGLPFLIIVFVTRFLRLGLPGGSPIYGFVLASGVTLCGLVTWEIIQNALWEYPADPNDILATGLGIVCAISTFMLLLRTGIASNKP